MYSKNNTGTLDAIYARFVTRQNLIRQAVYVVELVGRYTGMSLFSGFTYQLIN